MEGGFGNSPAKRDPDDNSRTNDNFNRLLRSPDKSGSLAMTLL